MSQEKLAGRTIRASLEFQLYGLDFSRRPPTQGGGWAVTDTSPPTGSQRKACARVESRRRPRRAVPRTGRRESRLAWPGLGEASAGSGRGGTRGARAEELRPGRPPSPPGREAGARQAAAARTCWRKLERLGSGQPSVKPGPGPAGAEGRGPSWRLPARPEQGSARAAPPRPPRVRELGDRTPLGLRGRDRKGLGGANSRRKGKGACFPGCGTEGPRGVAPRRPAHSRDPQAGPGRAGLGPRTPPGPRAPSPCRPPQPPPAEKEEAQGPHVPQTCCEFTPTTPALGSPLPSREGPCPPRPLPPGYIRSPRSRPRPGPARMRGRSGSRAPRAAPPWPCAEPQGWTDGGAGGGAAHALRGPAAARAPSTHLAPAPAAAGGAGSGAPGPPSTPCPRPLSPSSEGQSVRRLSPAALATCPKFRCPAASCARRPLPDPSGCAPLRRPAPSALPAAVGAAAAARWVQPAAAASAVTEPRARRRAPAVNPRPLPAAPGRGQHTPPTELPYRPQPPSKNNTLANKENNYLL
eukprot:XP_013973723.1 basic proline-rich protein-like [Canis lupus familiaris]